MTAADRKASTIRTGAVVWDSPTVTASVPGTLSGRPTLTVTAPAAIAGDLPLGTADFGAALTVAGLSGELVAATDAADAAGPSATDACSVLDNPGAVAGRIALVDRGTCFFVDKARNVQAAGAIGMVLANNVADTSALGNDRRRHLDHDSGRQRHAGRRRDAARQSRRRRRGEDARGPEPPLGRGLGEPDAALRAEPGAAGIVHVALGLERLSPPADAAEQLLGPAAHGRPHAAAAPGHRLGDRAGHGAACPAPRAMPSTAFRAPSRPATSIGRRGGACPRPPQSNHD